MGSQPPSANLCRFALKNAISTTMNSPQTRAARQNGHFQARRSTTNRISVVTIIDPVTAMP
jgi:hypothetical protein